MGPGMSQLDRCVIRSTTNFTISETKINRTYIFLNREWLVMIFVSSLLGLNKAIVTCGVRLWEAGVATRPLDQCWECSALMEWRSPGSPPYHQVAAGRWQWQSSTSRISENWSLSVIHQGMLGINHTRRGSYLQLIQWLVEIPLRLLPKLGSSI